MVRLIERHMSVCLSKLNLSFKHDNVIFCLFVCLLVCLFVISGVDKLNLKPDDNREVRYFYYGIYGMCKGL